jgi:hypothetical protein
MRSFIHRVWIHRNRDVFQSRDEVSHSYFVHVSQAPRHMWLVRFNLVNPQASADLLMRIILYNKKDIYSFQLAITVCIFRSFTIRVLFKLYLLESIPRFLTPYTQILHVICQITSTSSGSQYELRVQSPSLGTAPLPRAPLSQRVPSRRGCQILVYVLPGSFQLQLQLFFFKTSLATSTHFT